MSEATKQPPTVAVKIDKTVANQAAIIARYRGLTVRDVLVPLIGEQLRIEYERVVREMHEEIGTPAGA